MDEFPGPLSHSSEYVEAARSTLNCLNEVWKDGRDELKVTGSCSSTGCPFVAFIVIFGSAVMNDHADFELLDRSTKTIQSICEKSAGVGKLVQTCQSFYQTACRHYNRPHSPKTWPQQYSPTPATILGTGTVPGPVLAGQDSFDINPPTFNNIDLSLQNDWDQMLDGLELGLGAESAREMTSYLEQRSSMGGPGSIFG